MVRIFDTQLKHVASRYARLIKAGITETTLRRELEESPYYPSVLSLTKTFTKFNVPCKAFKIGRDDFHKLTPPFLALFKADGKNKDFILVTTVAGDNIAYVYDKEAPRVVARDDFFNDFGEIVWVADPGENSGEPAYKKKRQKEKYAQYRRAGVMMGVVLIFAMLLYANAAPKAPGVNWLEFTVLLLLKLIGGAVACLLLLYEVDKNNALVKSICAAGAGKKTNCEAVLSSKASRILGIGLGEIGFFYFTATALLLLFPGIPFSERLSWLAAMNICCVPYILFSLYYQWRVVKQWCKLCLATQAVLASEFICFIIFFWRQSYMPVISPLSVCFISSIVLFPVVAWYAIKPSLIKAKHYNLVYPALQRLKNDPAVFNMELQKQTHVRPGWENMGIAIGNPGAANIILEISSPYCIPCARAHPVIHSLVQQNKNVQARILFMNGNTAEDRGGKIAKHLLAIAERSDMDVVQALDDWYADRKYESFAAKYTLSQAAIESKGAELEQMLAWCIAAEIPFTPAIIINGRMLSDNYNLEDVRNIL